MSVQGSAQCKHERQKFKQRNTQIKPQRGKTLPGKPEMCPEVLTARSTKVTWQERKGNWGFYL